MTSHPGTAHPASARAGLRGFAAVTVGGMLGTALRLGVDTALPHESAEFAASALGVGAAAAAYALTR